tara:strand:- start:2622 stop:3692 length:1071 start_codon:yes stop_codon:yes gene_type:complete
MAITIDGTDGISPLKASGQTQTTTGTAASPAIASSSDTDSGFFFGTNEVNISTGGSTRATVDSSGRVLIGMSTAPSGGSFASTAKLASQGNTTETIGGAVLSLQRGEAATAISAGEYLGNICFTDSAGNEFARIDGLADTSAGSSDYPGRLSFSITGDGESSPTERLRIGNAAELTLRPATYGIGVRSVASSSSTNTAYFGAHSSTSISTGTITFEVYTNGNVKNTNNSYGQLSDERLKENIIDAPSQWDDIKSLQIRKYNFRDGNGYDTHTQIGLVAQEVQTVCPGLVQETPVREDATPVQDAEGNELDATKSVLTSVLYMKAVKALQEAQTRIETLETQNADLLARVTALEAAE